MIVHSTVYSTVELRVRALYCTVLYRICSLSPEAWLADGPVARRPTPPGDATARTRPSRQTAHRCGTRGLPVRSYVLL